MIQESEDKQRKNYRGICFGINSCTVSAKNDKKQRSLPVGVPKGSKPQELMASQ